MCIRDRHGMKYTFLLIINTTPVSYTHLDVYKRQILDPEVTKKKEKKKKKKIMRI